MSLPLPLPETARSMHLRPGVGRECVMNIVRCHVCPMPPTTMAQIGLTRAVEVCGTSLRSVGIGADAGLMGIPKPGIDGSWLLEPGFYCNTEPVHGRRELQSSDTLRVTA